MQKDLPNILSILRIIISPIFFLLLISNEPSFVILAFVLFTIGATTDYIDGWLARKYKSESSLGKFIDPLADKMLTTLAFIAFAIMDIMPFWMVLIIILRDIVTTLLRLLPNNAQMKIKTSYTAKVKTFVQMIFIFCILLILFFINTNISYDIINFLKQFLKSDFIYYIAFAITLFTLWTLIEYFFQIFKLKSIK